MGEVHVGFVGDLGEIEKRVNAVTRKTVATAAAIRGYDRDDDVVYAFFDNVAIATG